MASDRSPLSKRLKSLAQRAGLPVDDAPPAQREPAVAMPDTPVPPATPADEQPTGDVPLIAEQPTDDHPAVAPPAAEQPTTTIDALSHPSAADAPVSADPFVHGGGPSLTPPVVPARPEPAPATPESATPAPAEDDDDEPFSPRSTIWPQTAPTPRFEPSPEDAPSASEAADQTFPEPSPVPLEGDVAAPTDVAAGAAAIPAVPTAVSYEPTPGDPTPAEPATSPVEATGSGSTTESAALAPQSAGPRVLGGLRRLRGGKDRSATQTAAAVAAAAPAVVPAPAPAPEAVPAPTPAPVAVAPAAVQPPAKPSFTERAALRRRAKSLRARRDAGLLELGAIVLDQRRFGDPTGGSLQRRRTDELADLDSELAAIEQVLDDDGPAETVAQLGVVRCLTCAALVGPRDRFCVQCGAPRPEDADGGAPSGS